MEHTRLKISWIQHQIKPKNGSLTYPSPLSTPPISPPHSSSGPKISPAVLFIIVILAVLFFIFGLLHLLVRFLIKNPSSSRSNRFPHLTGPDALQRQLQQLFHLHDSGLDQAFIDALPVFQYREIVGLKEPFDCAVCLCEFTEKDKLRLLPMCSHAFHINCIDTWLLSNSTCPLCRGTLFAPGFSIENPMFDLEDTREDDKQKTVEIEEATTVVDKGVLPVRLGKFKKPVNENSETGEGETSSSNLGARRCFSMGSYQYVLGDSDLRVTLCARSVGKERNGDVAIDVDSEAKKISNVTKRESFSISKIWLWPKKGKFSSSSDVPQMGLPDSVNLDLPWINREQDK